ncbi:perilipin-2 [Pungitius pungitius]|uniref:perilipin-2 n=1 Tax=Pungitius pungitius TaxID=134920 RepID=UPI002E142878
MAAAVITNQNVVERVTSLPLVSSTYGLVSSAYSSTKGTHPYIRTVCEAAEQGVRTITSVALVTASPIIGKLELQIAIANNLACKGLDRIEKTLPILNQPSEQIVSSAKDVVTGTVSGARDTVSDTLTSVVGKTRGAVQGGMDKTRAVVSGSVSTVLESRVARLVSSGVDTALSTSESLVEQYLPLTEGELELEAEAVKGSDQKEPSYYVRLGSLSTKLRRRAYTRAVAKVRDGKQRSVDFISELNSTVDLIEYGRKNINGANQMVNNKLTSLATWRSNGANQHQNGHGAEVIEHRTLSLAQSLTQQLQTTCLVLVSRLQGLPSHIQQEALQLGRAATQVYVGFSKASSLGDLPDSVLSVSRVQLGRIKDSLDNVMDYLVNNTPLNWLVGPFYPRMDTEPTPTPALSSGQSHREEPMEVEMETLHSQQPQ